MYAAENFRKDRAKLLAEIEATRTPEQRGEAARVRAQRAAYDALSNSRKTEIEELEVFNAFAAVVAAEARIDSNSGINAESPEPDIRCTVAGARHYFELGEITDPPVAKSMADAIKHDEPRGCAFSQGRPFAYIIGKKSTRQYTTSGAPIELLLYYRTQSPPPASHFEELLNAAATDLQALTTGGLFQRVWIFDFSEKRVLWRS
jgi:hypothetical protein